MEDLKKLRDQIDKIDRKIVIDIKERFDLVQKIAEVKNKNSLPVEDNKRVSEVVNGRLALAKEFNLKPELIEKIFREIIDACTNYQKIILTNS